MPGISSIFNIVAPVIMMSSMIVLGPAATFGNVATAAGTIGTTVMSFFHS